MYASLWSSVRQMKMLRVGPGHARGTGRPGRGPRRSNCCSRSRRRRRSAAAGTACDRSLQLAPDRHAFPVDAEPLALDGRHAVGHALLQFGQQHVGNSRSPPGVPRSTTAGPIWIVPSKKVIGDGHVGRRLQHRFPQQRALLRDADHLAQPVDVELRRRRLPPAARPSASICSGHVVDQRVVHLADRPRRVDAEAGDVPLARVELEPVLHVAALVRVEDQHVGLGRPGQAHLLQRGLALQVRADVAGQIRADVGREAVGVGQRDQVGGHPRGAQHGPVVLREIDVEAHRPQQLGRADAGAPGRLLALGGPLAQIGEVLAHHGSSSAWSPRNLYVPEQPTSRNSCFHFLQESTGRKPLAARPANSSSRGEDPLAVRDRGAYFSTPPRKSGKPVPAPWPRPRPTGSRATPSSRTRNASATIRSTSRSVISSCPMLARLRPRSRCTLGDDLGGRVAGPRRVTARLVPVDARPRLLAQLPAVDQAADDRRQRAVAGKRATQHALRSAPGYPAPPCRSTQAAPSGNRTRPPPRRSPPRSPPPPTARTPPAGTGRTAD